MSGDEAVELPETGAAGELGRAAEAMVREPYRAPVHVTVLLVIAGLSLGACLLWTAKQTLNVRTSLVDLAEAAAAPKWESQRQTNEGVTKRLDAGDQRTRILEQDFAGMTADLKTLKEDVHFLREHAEKERGPE